MEIQHKILYVNQIPSHLLLNILYKLNNLQLCRIRRTCSSMDRFVEERRKKLSKRRVGPEPFEYLNVSIVTEVDYYLCKTGHRKVDLYDNRKQLSAISFTNGHVSYFHADHTQTLELIKELEISCGTFHICTGAHIECMKITPTELVEETLKAIVSFEKLSIYQAASDDGLKDLNFYLNMFQNSKIDPKNCVITIYNNEENTCNGGLWEQARKFSSVDFGNIQKQDLVGFIWDVFHSQDQEFPKYVQLYVMCQEYEDRYSILNELPIPANYIIFDKDDFPNDGNFRSVIRVIETPSTCMIIMETPMEYLVRIDFAPLGSDECFLKITDFFCFDAENLCKDEFFASSPEGKRRLIKEAMNNMFKRRP